MSHPKGFLCRVCTTLFVYIMLETVVSLPKRDKGPPWKVISDLLDPQKIGKKRKINAVLTQ